MSSFPLLSLRPTLKSLVEDASFKRRFCVLKRIWKVWTKIKTALLLFRSVDRFLSWSPEASKPNYFWPKFPFLTHQSLIKVRHNCPCKRFDYRMWQNPAFFFATWVYLFFLLLLKVSRTPRRSPTRCRSSSTSCIVVSWTRSRWREWTLSSDSSPRSALATGRSSARPPPPPASSSPSRLPHSRNCSGLPATHNST